MNVNITLKTTFCKMIVKIQKRTLCELNFSNPTKKLTSQQLLKLRPGTPAALNRALSLIQLRYFCKQKQTLNFAERNFLKRKLLELSISRKKYISRGNMSSITVTPLGAGQDVGRSCLLVCIGGKRIMLDCGV